MAERAGRLALGLALTAGLVLRVWGLQFGFPHPFARTDEEVIVDVALGVLRDPNPHFFDWPTLFMYVTGAAYWTLFALERTLGGPIRHAAVAKSSFLTTLHLTARVLSAAAGTLTIAAVYAAARELFSTRVAVVAAAFLAVAFLHVRDSHFGVTDVPATLLVVRAFWAAARLATSGTTTRRVVAAGFLCGLATATKYNAALVLLLAVYAIATSPSGTGRQSILSAVRSIAILVTAAALTFIVATPYSILDHRSFVDDVMNVRSHLSRGHVVVARCWTYHTLFILRYGLVYPMLIAAIGGFASLLVRRRRELILLLTFLVSYYVVLGSGRTVFARYMMPIVPFICIGAAV